jgi:hypothetical protein
MDSAVSSAKSVLRRLWEMDRPLTAVGLAMLPLLAMTIVALVLDPRQIGGAPAWMKPAKFAASIAIYTLTLAWIFTYLPEWVKTRRVVSWVTAVVLVLEILIIDLQAWRGTTSHFNVGTPFDMILFSVMGLAIFTQTLTSVAVAIALWRRLFPDRALGWALRIGMTVTIVGAMTGGLMTQPTRAQLDDVRAGKRMTLSGAHTVGAPDGGPGLPGTGWSLEHGDLRVAHFVGLHAVQALALVWALGARRPWSAARRVRLTLVASASYISLFGLLMWQALRGQPVVRPDGTMMMALLLWVTLTVALLAAVFYRPDEDRTSAPAY